MITTADETWATDTLRDAQDPGAGKQSWDNLTRLTIERYNLIFAQEHSRGYASTGDSKHDAATALENGFATLLKVAVDTASDDAVLTKWSVASGLEYDDKSIIPGASLSDTARPSIEVTAGVALTIRVFYVGESDANVYYRESVDGGATIGAEQAVGAQANLKAIASVSPTKVHCVSYTNGNSRFHFFEDDGGWSETDSLLYWPHLIEHIDAITIGDRDLVVFYSQGPMYGNFREAGIYGIWQKHGRWSDIFLIDVLDEADDYSYRKNPMLSTANGIIFLTGYLSEGDSDYSHATRFLKTSKDGQNWSQYQPLVVCSEAGPAKLLVINAVAGQSWPFSTGQQAYVVGYDKIYESDATRLVGEINTALQVDVSSRVPDRPGWSLTRGVISQATTVLANYDGALDSHSLINDDNTLLLVREAGYRTGAGDEYAQLSLEQVDVIKEADELPRRSKQVITRDFMAWMRDREADHFQEWESQLVGYDNYHDDSETGYGGLGHTATQSGWWKTSGDMLWLISDNKEGIAFATWDSRIMNGQVKAMGRVETSGNDEYAGAIFRAKDTGNLWAAYYDQATDKIVLRQKVGGTWLAAVATTGALSWSIDTWYGIYVDFRYSYVRVYYSVDGLTWTEAFTYVIPQNPSLPANEYGYVGVIGYGYSDQDEDDPPGYEPPTLPPPIVPPGPGAAGDGNLLYFVDRTTGRVFRTRNAREFDPTAVVYEALPVVDAGGLNYITLDSWNPKNGAMACGPNGVWKTTNLDDAAPDWTKVYTAASGECIMIASSICQQDLWMFSQITPPGAYWALYVATSINGGGDWTGYEVTSAQHVAAARYTTQGKIEFSSHHAQTAWATWAGSGGARHAKTTDLWTGISRGTIGIGGDWGGIANPHHRFFANPDDDIAFWAAGTQTLICTTDPVTGCTSGAVAATPLYIACSTWTSNRYFLLSNSMGGRLYVSGDAINWTDRGEIGGTNQAISGWPRGPDRLYACQDGVVAPLLISDDEGQLWQEQTGNWATLGINGDIRCCVPVWTE